MAYRSYEGTVKAAPGRGWNSLRSVGSAQSPELRPSGVDTARRLLPRKDGVWRLVRLGSGATRAPRNCETNRIGFEVFFCGTTYVHAGYDATAKKVNPVRFPGNEGTGEVATVTSLPLSRGAGWLFFLFVHEDAFDAGVGGEPEEGDGDEEGVGDPGADEGEGDGEEVERGRDFAFPVVADGGGEEGVGALLLDDGGLQNVVGDGGHEEDEAVDGGGYRSEMVLADPRRGEREKREPEKQVEVRPEDAARDFFGGVEQVMMVVPIDADVDETEDVAEEDGQERFQDGEVGRVRDFQSQHHDGDDDREDAIAEGFEPGGFHCAGAGCPKATAFAERKVGGLFLLGIAWNWVSIGVV